MQPELSECGLLLIVHIATRLRQLSHSSYFFEPVVELRKMKLTQKHINRLIELHRQATGETLSYDEASEMGTRLLNLYAVLNGYRPEPRVRTLSHLRNSHQG